MTTKAVDILFDDEFKSESTTKQQSTSHEKYSHSDHGICPVCNTQMITANIGDEPIFYCTEHRISMPMPE